MRKHSKLRLLIGNKYSDNNEFYMFNYGRFQGKNETKSGLTIIFNEIENKYYFTERTFVNRGRMEQLKATG